MISLESVNGKFSDAERVACIPIIERMTKLIVLYRREGIFSLMDELKPDDCSFLKGVIYRTVVGINDEDEILIMTNLIMADRRSNLDLLSRMITGIGLFYMRIGGYELIGRLEMSALLGEKYMLELNPDFFNID